MLVYKLLINLIYKNLITLFSLMCLVTNPLYICVRLNIYL